MNAASGDEAAAASVRELQSVLMVAALRCQISHHDMTADCNRFLVADRATIQAMNERLRAHFIAAAGPVRGQTAYDAFATTLANGHGAEASGAGECGPMASLAREAALMAGSEEGLPPLVARAGLVIALPEGGCTAAPHMLATGTTPHGVAPAPAGVGAETASASGAPTRTAVQLARADVTSAQETAGALPSIFASTLMLKVASLAP